MCRIDCVESESWGQCFISEGPATQTVLFLLGMAALACMAGGSPGRPGQAGLAKWSVTGDREDRGVT